MNRSDEDCEIFQVKRMKPDSEKCDDKRHLFNYPFSEAFSKCFSISPNAGKGQSLNQNESAEKMIGYQQRKRKDMEFISCSDAKSKSKPSPEEKLRGNRGSFVKKSSRPTLETIFENGNWENGNDQWPGPSTQIPACEPTKTTNEILSHEFDSDDYAFDPYMPFEFC